VHANQYAGKVIERFGINNKSLVIEIASNDGYLLQYFVERGIPSLGIEPAEKTAVEARKRGVETIVNFFNQELAEKLAQQKKKADLLIGNNVLAHVPELNDFVSGLKIALNTTGIITMEFPHVVKLYEMNQFDTIYHEHFSYLSFLTVVSILKHHGLKVFDVEELQTHGGSLRIYACHTEDCSKEISENVTNLLELEKSLGIDSVNFYKGFQKKADTIKYDFLEFLIKQKKQCRKVVAYGAAAKGNTLLNYCGVRADLIEFVVDASPYKQGKYLPGSHIPVLKETEIRNCRPEYVLILPWNIKDEITEQLDYIRSWGGKFVVAVPSLNVF
jgi:hypothetical protein